MQLDTKDNENNILLTQDIAAFNIDFNLLTPEMFSQAYDFLLQGAQEEFDQTLACKRPSYQQLFYHPMTEKLMKVHHLLGSLNALKEDSGLRDIEQHYSAILSEKFTMWSLDSKMYRKMQAFQKSRLFQKQTPSRQKIIQKVLKNLNDHGVNLPQKKKRQLARLNQKLTMLSQRFENNITDAQGELSVIATKRQLKGLPQRAWQNAYALQKTHGLAPNKFLIDEASGLLSDVMQNCPNETIRKKIYYKRRELCNQGKYTNKKLIDQIYKVKQQSAVLLGYKDFAHMNLSDNMAKTPAAVLEFLEHLGNIALPHAKQDLLHIRAHGEKLLGRPMQWWDNEFVIHHIKEDQLKMPADMLRQYFPVQHVMQALFNLCEELFAVKFVLNPTRSVWHEDVRYFDVYEHDKLTGGLFMDLYKRPGKTPGAWLDPVCSYENNDIEQRQPVALLVCNAPKDVNQEPTFTIDEIVTLFHEMGHALHHLLSKVDEEFFSGFNNVEHDAVELPSQLMENFVYQTDMLKKLSCHVQTGASLDEQTIEKIQKNKKFLGPATIVNMVRYSEMDMKLYMQHDAHPYEIEEQAFAKWSISDNYDAGWRRMPIFSHIFGGYAAGYYSYQWAEVLAADGFNYLTTTCSEEQAKRIQRYKEEILYTGGSRPMEENYTAFAGQPANVKYLIESYI